MSPKIINVRTDFQPEAGQEYTASAYPEPGAYLIDWCGGKHVAFVTMSGSIMMQAASGIILESPTVAPAPVELKAEKGAPTVREEFALQLLATALAPDRRATP